MHPDILEQQSGVFVTAITFGLATVGQRKETRQTINKALRPALRITLQLNSDLIQIKESLSTSKCVACRVKMENHLRMIRQEESGQWKTFAEEKWTRK